VHQNDSKQAIPVHIPLLGVNFYPTFKAPMTTTITPKIGRRDRFYCKEKCRIARKPYERNTIPSAVASVGNANSPQLMTFIFDPRAGKVGHILSKRE
jgi:hypothetical protein